MKIFSALQIKEADKFTMISEPVSSLALMERAGEALHHALSKALPDASSFVVFCGPGNNGGDGLVLARLLIMQNKTVEVVLLKGNYTPELNINLQKAKELNIKITEVDSPETIESLRFPDEAVFIDALFGIGLTRPLEGIAALLVHKINTSADTIIAIDIPSGLSHDLQFKSTPENTVMADLTLTIQLPKLSFFFAENEIFTGSFDCIDIGISTEFIATQNTSYNFVTDDDVHAIIKPRSVTAHKGTFGHALIIAGSEGKYGASILASHAALRSGCGVLTAAIPEAAAASLRTVLPEAMTIIRDGENPFEKQDLSPFQAIGFGPGVGLENSELMSHVLTHASSPMVIDADGITLLSQNKAWYKQLGPHIILTPHPGEFDRLTHPHESGFERFKSQIEFSKTYQVTILLKGHHTSVTTPSGIAYFNSTGNDGMATAGSGDVLTGIITSLLAQGYNSKDAAVLGAFLHGYAGDEAAAQLSRTSLIASDIIQGIPAFFLDFEK